MIALERTRTNRLCAVCNSADATFMFHPTRSPGPVVRCRNCGFVYVSSVLDDHAIIEDGPVLKDRDAGLLTSDDLRDAEDWWESAHLPSKEKEWPAIRVDAGNALNHIQRRVSPPGRLLDFGCGFGFFLAAAKERGWEPYGLEPLPGPAIHARARFGATVVTDTLREGTFPPDFFDAITAFQVFEHIPEPEEVVRLLRYSLRPGGVILIEVPNIATWGVRALGKHHRHFVQDHLNFFSDKTLARLLERAGFRNVTSFHPTRHMTLGHLMIDWGQRVLPVDATFLDRYRSSGLMNRVIPVNLRDIVTVVAQKPPV